jgi:hypothetical protein
MATIRVTPDQLELTFRLWLKIIGQRQPSLVRDLWTRKGDEYDKDKLERTRREFARVLTQRFLTAGWDIMREETAQDHIWEAERRNNEKQLLLPRLDLK